MYGCETKYDLRNISSLSTIKCYNILVRNWILRATESAKNVGREREIKCIQNKQECKIAAVPPRRDHVQVMLEENDVHAD